VNRDAAVDLQLGDDVEYLGGTHLRLRGYAVQQLRLRTKQAVHLSRTVGKIRRQLIGRRLKALVEMIRRHGIRLCPDRKPLRLVAEHQLALGTVSEVHVPDPACEAARDISRALAGVISCVYGVKCPDSALMTAVGLYRASQKALDSKSSGLRRHFDYLPKDGAIAAYIRALSLRPDPLPHTPFTNDDHVAWPHAFVEGRVVSESFGELYVASTSKAQDALPAFAQTAVGESRFEDIVAGVNFLGQPVN